MEELFQVLPQRERNLCGFMSENKGKKNKRDKREDEFETKGRNTGRVEVVSIAECSRSFLFLRFNF